MLHGWNGQVKSLATGRVADMASVESHASGYVGPSQGERLVKVLTELEKRTPAIKQVRLVDPVKAFPKRWQDVLARLPVVMVSVVENVSRGFLSQLQGNLRLAFMGQSFEKIDWRSDGSVTVVQAESKILGASWLARQLDGQREALLISTTDGARLDGHLAAAGQARHGLKEFSAFRPALQVLPLALEILWEPVNYYGLVQFLTHPVCPVPGYARRQLAAKVADAPGIGGKRWERVLAEIDKYYGDETAPAIREKISLWVEHTRYPQHESAPIEAVIGRVANLVEFFRARLGADDPAKRIAFSAGYAQCRACLESLKALQAQSIEIIRPRQLQKLVMQATANGTDNPLLAAEVGANLAVTHPGAAIAPVDRVVWWHLTMPALPENYPWSFAEVRELASSGVLLPSADEQLDWTAEEWLRPILAARTQLTLVLPPKGEEVHPVWQMIEAVVNHPVIQPLETILKEESESTVPVEHMALPSLSRWWQLPEDVQIPLRGKESFSSLELLLFNPYHWLLKYPAALCPSRIVSLGGEFRMMGNLAHGLVESLYQRADALRMSEAEFAVWFDAAFDQLVSEEGALLRMPGRGADLESFRHRLHVSVQALREQITQAGITMVTPEMELSGHFTGGSLSGYADLVVEKADGALGIVDMKWSGAKKYPEKLKQNRHLQLAIYASLLQQKTGVWPKVAYYILDRARFFAKDDDMFPAADIVPSQNGENTALLWQRFNESWKWRKAQLETGLVEVALEQVEPDDESAPPEEGIPAEYLNQAYNDYLSLAGWRD
jgi:hypothetical protein